MIDTRRIALRRPALEFPPDLLCSGTDGKEEFVSSSRRLFVQSRRTITSYTAVRPPVSALSRSTCFAIISNLGARLRSARNLNINGNAKPGGITRADCPVGLLACTTISWPTQRSFRPLKPELKVSGGLTRRKSELPFVVVAR
jgi:hypothetical protein